MKGAKSPLRVQSTRFSNFFKVRKSASAGRKDFFDTLNAPPVYPRERSAYRRSVKTEGFLKIILEQKRLTEKETVKRRVFPEDLKAGEILPRLRKLAYPAQQRGERTDFQFRVRIRCKFPKNHTPSCRAEQSPALTARLRRAASPSGEVVFYTGAASFFR